MKTLSVLTLALLIMFQAVGIAKGNPESPDDFRRPAESYERMGEYEKALADLDKSAALNPDDARIDDARQSILSKMKK